MTLVVIPEVVRELKGLARNPGRGQAGPAIQALSTIETAAARRGSQGGVPIGRWGVAMRVLPAGSAGSASADAELVARAKAEQGRQRGSLVAVATRDWGVADRARAAGVKSILIQGRADSAGLERGIAEHDSMLDIEA